MPDSAVTASVLVYSHDRQVRDKVRLAVGRRPAKDVTVDYIEAGTAEEVVRTCDEQYVDVAVLDGEAWPTGGMGLCRQLKAELDEPPLVLVLTGRHDDAWLATWAQADAAVPYPLDAVRLAEAVADLARRSPLASRAG